jgi:hypothetical protein
MKNIIPDRRKASPLIHAARLRAIKAYGCIQKNFCRNKIPTITLNTAYI